jgi:hypothetical protein
MFFPFPALVPYFIQNPTSYIAYRTLSDAYLEFEIEISFKPEATNGLILYNGQKTDGSGDFISFGLNEGYAEFRFDCGSGPALIRTEAPLTLGQWHSASLKRNRRSGKSSHWAYAAQDDMLFSLIKRLEMHIELASFIELFCQSQP